MKLLKKLDDHAKLKYKQYAFLAFAQFITIILSFFSTYYIYHQYFTLKENYEFLTTDYEDCVRVENDINDLHIQADKEIGVQNGQ